MTTTTSIVLASANIVGQITELVDRIGDATAGEAKAAYDRMAMAREWAKLQTDTAELLEQLVWLEANLLRRIGEIDATVLQPPRRAAARHFATLDEATLAKLITDYPARTAVSVYNLWARSQGLIRQTNRGKARVRGDVVTERTAVDYDEEAAETIRRAVQERITSVRQAAALLIDEYTFSTTVGTLGQIVDDFIDEELPCGEHASPLEVSAFRRGLSSALREAFASAPVAATERSWEIPAFITTYDDESGTWLRVPSEFATVADARKMLALRRGQVAAATRSLESLERVFTQRFRVDEGDPHDYLRDDVTALTRRSVRQQRDTA